MADKWDNAIPGPSGQYSSVPSKTIPAGAEWAPFTVTRPFVKCTGCGIDICPGQTLCSRCERARQIGPPVAPSTAEGEVKRPDYYEI